MLSKYSDAASASREATSHSELLDEGHDSGEEGLKMDDRFGAISAATLEEHGILENFRLDGVW